MVIILVFLVILLITRSKRLLAFFHRNIERQLKKRRYPRRVALEQALQLNKDYGVCEVKIDKRSRYVDRQLSDTDFKEKGFVVLAMGRSGCLITVPKGSDSLKDEDIIIVFGNLQSLKDITKHAA